MSLAPNRTMGNRSREKNRVSGESDDGEESRIEVQDRTGDKESSVLWTTERTNRARRAHPAQHHALRKAARPQVVAFEWNVS